MAYSDSFPAIRPSFQFNADAGRLDPRISYSRSTTGTYFGTEKVLGSENLLLQSQDFDTSWVASGVGAPTGSQTAPDGTSTAWLLTCSSGTNTGPRILQTYTATASTEYTAVAHLKAGTASHGYLAIRTDGTNQYAGALLDFSAGTISVTAVGMTSQSGTVTALGSGWFKVTVTATSSSSLGSPNVNIGISDGTAIGVYGRAVWSPVGTETMYAWGAQLSTTGTKVYDSPSTTQIAREYQTKLQTAAINAPRFEFSATDSASMGLLIEGQSQNLLPNGATGYNSSDVFSWTTMYSNFAQNAAIAPTGSLEATHFYEDTEPTTQHRITVSVTATAAAHTLSGYFKSAGRDDVQFRVTNGGVNYWAKFNFSTETASDAGNPFSSLRVSSVGNGWYRFEATTPTLTAGSTTIYVNLYNGSMTYTGDGYSGVLFYGLQFEAGAASSLIATVDSAATRAADSASVDLTQAGFNGGPFSIVSETEGGQGVYPRAWTLTDGTLDNRLTVYRNSGTATTSTNWFYYGASEASAQVSSSVTGSASAGKLAVSYDTNDVSFCASGGTVTNDTSAVIPKNITTLIFGAQANATANKLNGHVKRIALYGEALSDTNLQALTK